MFQHLVNIHVRMFPMLFSDVNDRFLEENFFTLEYLVIFMIDRPKSSSNPIKTDIVCNDLFLRVINE